MCGSNPWARRAAARTEAYDAETVRLDVVNGGHSDAVARWKVGFPWWTLWMIWPLMGLLKAAGAALAPLLVLLTTPVALEVTLLPVLLIALGVVLVVFSRRRG